MSAHAAKCHQRMALCRRVLAACLRELRVGSPHMRAIHEHDAGSYRKMHRQALRASGAFRRQVLP